MNIAIRGLTPTQREARERHQKFKQSIADRAARLRDDKLADALRKLIPEASEPVPVAAPEPAPPEPAPPPKYQPWFYHADYPPRAYPTILEIQTVVGKYFGVGVTDILSARKTNHIVRARQIAYYLAKELTLFSLPVIGKHFGGRDHSTALWGIEKIKRLLPIDARLALDVATLFEVLTGEAQ